MTESRRNTGRPKKTNSRLDCIIINLKKIYTRANRRPFNHSKMGLTRKSDISENISTKNKAARLARRTYAEKNWFWMCYFQKSPNLTFDARKFVWRKPGKKDSNRSHKEYGKKKKKKWKVQCMGLCFLVFTEKIL